MKQPKEYSVGEILRATEGAVAPVSCLEGKENFCPRCARCATLPVWQRLQNVENRYLDSISLEDILSGQADNNYSI